MAVIYGDNTLFEECRTALYNAMVALQSAMIPDYEPRPYSVYNTHEKVKVVVPSVTVGVMEIRKREDQAGIQAGTSPTVATTYDVYCDIRVHKDYRGGYRDEINLCRLLNSVSNWMETHRALSITGFQFVEMGDITVKDEFEETLTIGGKLELMINVALSHTQA